jgi:hypothetical protein
VERGIDCTVRGKARRSEAGSKAGTFIIACVGNDNDLREVEPEQGRCSFTGVPRALSRVDHTTLAEPRQNSIALLQR